MAGQEDKATCNDAIAILEEKKAELTRDADVLNEALSNLIVCRYNRRNVLAFRNLVEPK